MDCHALLQGVFLTQWSNQDLTHFRQILYHPCHQGIKWLLNQSFAELLRHLLNMFWKHEIQAKSVHINSHVRLHSCWPGAEAKSTSGRGPGPAPAEDTPPIPSSALKTVDSTTYIAQCPKSRLLPLLPPKQRVGIQVRLRIPLGYSTWMWWASQVAQAIKHPPAMQTWLQSLGWEDSPGEGSGNPLQYSCLGNLLDREAWWATAHAVTKELDTT